MDALRRETNLGIGGGGGLLGFIGNRKVKREEKIEKGKLDLI